MPVELHQATVSKVVCFLDCGRHLKDEAKRRRGTGGQRQPRERWLRQVGKTSIDVQKKRADRRIDIARADPNVREQPDCLRWVRVVDAEIVVYRPSWRRGVPSLRHDHRRLNTLELLFYFFRRDRREVLAFVLAFLHLDHLLRVSPVFLRTRTLRN
jgi:hypothetical protein